MGSLQLWLHISQEPGISWESSYTSFLPILPTTEFYPGRRFAKVETENAVF